MKLEGKVAIVTGASSGIGEATAIALAKEGAVVVLAARRTERLENIKNLIEFQGGKAISMQVDVSMKEQVENMVHQVKNQFGKIDILVNNAGIMLLSFFNKGKVEEWERMIDVNIKGVLYGLNAVLPIMKEQRTGHIINIASIAGFKVFPSSSVYSATKYAVRAITEGLRIELADQPGIRITTISPGAVATELTSHITDEVVAKSFATRKMVSLNSEDIANAVIYAATQPDHVDVNEMIVRPVEQRDK